MSCAFGSGTRDGKAALKYTERIKQAATHETGHLARDDAHDHRLCRTYKDMVEPHGPEQAVGPRQAGIGMHHEGCALHEGPQVNVHVPLIISQVPAQHSCSSQSLACSE